MPIERLRAERVCADSGRVLRIQRSRSGTTNKECVKVRQQERDGYRVR